MTMTDRKPLLNPDHIIVEERDGAWLIGWLFDKRNPGEAAMREVAKLVNKLPRAVGETARTEESK